MQIYVQNPRKVSINKKEIERETGVRLRIKGKYIELDGEEDKKYLVLQILEAVNFGFTTNQALKLISPEFIFEKIKIKQITHRKNLRDVKARIIGTKGKAIRNLCELSDCDIVLKENEVGIIAPAEGIKKITRAIESLIHGAKHSNVYSFLERHRSEHIEDLGLREKNK